MSKEERNKKAIGRLYSDIFDQDVTAQTLAMVDELFEADVMVHDPATPKGFNGTDGLKQLLAVYRKAFPDHRYHVNDILADGDKTTCRWTVTGTHQGEMMGIPARGCSVKVEGISISRFNDEGKIVEVWQLWDRQGLLECLGGTESAARVGD